MAIRNLVAPTVLVSAALLSSHPALAQFSQQGSKLVGTGADGAAAQGVSVSLSADGSTAIVGGSTDHNFAGAAWVWTRSGGSWNQQSTKLVGSGTVGTADQGASVSLSADGNTAIVGGWGDNGRAGAAWVWTRSGGVWTQQSRLVGAGAVGNAGQGVSVSISADGNTALVGGNLDNGNAGAAWVWTRSGGVWTQQSTKLVGSGAVGNAGQGVSLFLSTDGNTAIVGGSSDNSNAGAAWVWTRSGGVWTQQGSKLVGTGAVGAANQGSSVSLSADGNTAIVGGTGDNSQAGAAWVWSRSGGVWTQQSTKLVGAGAVQIAEQGNSVSLSGDGNTAIVGGFNDNRGVGAAWVWTRSGNAWAQSTKLVGSGSVGNAGQGASVSLSSDGNTAMVGGGFDNNNAGAAWVFNAASAAGQPDLVPQSVLLSSTSMTTGGALAVNVTVKNEGTGNAAATTTMIRLNSNSGSSSSSDPIQQGVSTPAITAGSSATLSAAFTLNTAGIYYAHVYVDSNAVLSQSNVGNDTYHSGPITVSAGQVPGIVIGPSGGDVTGLNGIKLEIPAGSLTGNTNISIVSVPASQLEALQGFTFASKNLRFLQAISIRTGGAQFAKVPTLSATVDPNLLSASLILVLKDDEDVDGDGMPDLVLKDLGLLTGTRIQTTAAAALPGVSQGTFVFLQTMFPIGLMSGQVVDANGAPAVKAMVTSFEVPFLFAQSDVAGNYLVPVAAAEPTRRRAIAHAASVGSAPSVPLLSVSPAGFPGRLVSALPGSVLRGDIPVNRPPSGKTADAPQMSINQPQRDILENECDSPDHDLAQKFADIAGEIIKKFQALDTTTIPFDSPAGATLSCSAPIVALRADLSPLLTADQLDRTIYDPDVLYDLKGPSNISYMMKTSVSFNIGATVKALGEEILPPAIVKYDTDLPISISPNPNRLTANVRAVKDGSVEPIYVDVNKVSLIVSLDYEIDLSDPSDLVCNTGHLDIPPFELNVKWARVGPAAVSVQNFSDCLDVAANTAPLVVDSSGICSASTLMTVATKVGTPETISYNVTTDVPWATVQPEQGGVRTPSPNQHTITVNNRDKLHPGTYPGTVVVSPVSPVVNPTEHTPHGVGVFMNVSAETSGVTPPSLNFTDQDHSPKVLSVQTATCIAHWTAKKDTDATWLNLTSFSGVSPSSVTATVDATGLQPGSYDANITFTFDGGTQQAVPVTLTIGTVSISLSPTNMTFSATEGGFSPSSQTLTVTNAGQPGSVLNYHVSTDAAWLLVDGPVRPLSVSDSERLTVSVNIAGLTANGSNLSTDTGHVTVADVDTPGISSSIPVTLTIEPSTQPPPLVVSFAASVATINPGQSSTLSWTTTNATSVSISGVVAGQPVNGSVSVSPVVTTTYTLTAAGPGGTVTATATVTVNAVSSPAVLSFVADPTTVNSGQSSTLSWSTTNATSVSISGVGAGKPLSGSALVSPAVTTTFTLTATGPGGTATATATVTVSGVSPGNLTGSYAGTFTIRDHYTVGSCTGTAFTYSGSVTMSLVQTGSNLTGTLTFTGVKYQDGKGGCFLVDQPPLMANFVGQENGTTVTLNAGNIFTGSVSGDTITMSDAAATTSGGLFTFTVTRTSSP